MFRIECLVTDNRLADVMHALSGQVHDLKVTPVVMPSTPGGDLFSLFVDYLKKRNVTQFVGPQVARDFLKSVGRSPESSTYLLKESIKRRVLCKAARKGNTVTYALTSQK